MPLPTVKSQPALTIVGRRLIARITPDGGAAQTHLCRKIGMKPLRGDYIERLAPTANPDSILMVDRRVPKVKKDTFTLHLDEWNQALLDLLNSNGGKAKLLVQVVDPGSETGYSSLRACGADDYLDFDCLVEDEGDQELTMEAVAKYGLKLQATEEVVYEPEAMLLDFETTNADGIIEVAMEYPSGLAPLGYVEANGTLITLNDAVATSFEVDTAPARVRVFRNLQGVTDIILTSSQYVSRASAWVGRFPKLTNFQTNVPITGLLADPQVNRNLATVNVAGSQLTAAALDALYRSLPDRTGLAAGAITVTGNPGTGADTPAIATAKNWTVTGS